MPLITYQSHLINKSLPLNKAHLTASTAELRRVENQQLKVKYNKELGSKPAYLKRKDAIRTTRICANIICVRDDSTIRFTNEAASAF